MHKVASWQRSRRARTTGGISSQIALNRREPGRFSNRIR